MNFGLLHFHRRKRIHQRYEPYPHPNRLKNMMDRLIYFFGILGPVMAIPQLAEIWVVKNTQGVSEITWGAFLIIAFFWLFYGILHKEKPIIITYIGWIIADLLILAGILIY